MTDTGSCAREGCTRPTQHQYCGGTCKWICHAFERMMRGRDKYADDPDTMANITERWYALVAVADAVDAYVEVDKHTRP